jgi:hypothetical protein
MGRDPRFGISVLASELKAIELWNLVYLEQLLTGSADDIDHRAFRTRCVRKQEILNFGSGAIQMTPEHAALCESIRKFGYGKGRKIKLYGESLQLVSDPVCDSYGSVSVDARECRSGRVIQVRLPLHIISMVRDHNKTAA